MLQTAGSLAGASVLGGVGASVPNSDRACQSTDECDDIDYAYARVVADEVEGASSRESYCTVERRLADSLGVAEGDQLRLGSYRCRDDQLYPEKLFTVTDVRRDRFAVVTGNEDDLADVGLDGRVVGRVSATIPNPCHDSYEDAREHSEFVETTYGEDLENGGSFVVLAPHGGFEWGTHAQAEVAADVAEVPAWICYGQNEDVSDDVDSFARWHVTSTEISFDSFPALREVERAGFDAALSFHGKSSGGEYVGVGGRATELRSTVASRLCNRVEYLEDEDVRVCGPEDCEYPALAECNVVNRVTESGDGGVQIEQPWDLRQAKHERVAEVAAKAMRDELEGE